MPKISAGLLMYRRGADGLELFLVHPGGPFFRAKDAGYWSIPKGLPEAGEALEAAAAREFFEETGIEPADSRWPLGSVQQKGGKVVHAWAFEGDWDPATGLGDSTFELEWPPRSGRRQSFPEVDRAAFFGMDEARVKINSAQVAFIDRLEVELG